MKDENGHIKEVVLQVMELGEPDESGRRRPVPVEGVTETIALDTMILAIGQAVDASLFDCDKTRKGAIAYDKETFMTSIPGVFAGGDCGNDKISIAVEAIADAKKASEIIDAYLYGEEVKYREQYVVTKDVTAEDFEDRERLCRPELPQLSPEERKDNFSEVIPEGYSIEDAIAEASRCLECGCHDYFECKLIDFANQYDVHPERFAGEKNTIDFNDDHPFIVRDPNKCILCGLCVRVCDEVMGVGALGLVNRGFDTVVKPNMEKPLIESGCISCGQCVSVCPTGALQERTSLVKEVPVDTEHTLTTCSMCSVGCTLDLETRGDMLVKANPYKEGIVNQGLACGKGKWGFDSAILEGKIEDCLIREGDDWREADYHETLMLIAKKCQIAAQRYGRDAVAVAVSDRYTNEEAYAIKVMADAIGAKLLCLNNRQSGLREVLGVEGSPNTIDELLSTNLILKVGFEPADSRVIDIKIKQAAERGAQVLDLTEAGNDLSFLKELAKALIEQGKGEKLEGFEELKNSLENVTVSEKAQILCDQYLKAKKAMIVYQVNNLTVDGAKLVGDIALLSGHIGKPRDGVLAVLPKNNSQGLHDLGITAGAEALEGVKALVVFGENAPLDTDNLEFLAVCDTHMTDLGDKATVFIPGTGFASTNGTFTNTERRLQAVEAAVDEGILLANWEVAQEIAHIFEVETPWEDTDDISDEMCDTEPLYKYSIMDEVRGGVLAPVAPKLVAVPDGPLTDPLETTDSLMQSIIERIPKPACPTA